MGCTTSTTAFTETIAVSGIVDLALLRQLTDNGAVELAEDIQFLHPVSLRMPRFACPSAKLGGDGLSQLCIAGAGSLTTVELNEAALPRVTAEAAAQALGFLGDVREVSIRGESWPRRILSILSEPGAIPMSSVRSVLLGGAGVDSATLLALPKAFPCCQKLYFQNPSGITDWMQTAKSLAAQGVMFMHVNRLVFDAPTLIDDATVKVLEDLFPLLRSGHRRKQRHPQYAHEKAAAPQLFQTAVGGPAAGTSQLMSPRSLDTRLAAAAPQLEPLAVGPTNPLRAGSECSDSCPSTPNSAASSLVWNHRPAGASFASSASVVSEPPLELPPSLKPRRSGPAALAHASGINVPPVHTDGERRRLLPAYEEVDSDSREKEGSPPRSQPSHSGSVLVRSHSPASVALMSRGPQAPVRGREPPGGG